MVGLQPEDHNLTSTGEWSFTTKGVWLVSTRVDPIDDSQTVVLSVKSSSAVSIWGKPIALVLRCKSYETNAYIGWQDYLGSETVVTTRIGKDKAKTARWNLSNDGLSSFHTKPIDFIKNMMGNDVLVAQTTPYRESTVTAIFNISGLENAIEPLRTTCNW